MADPLAGLGFVDEQPSPPPAPGIQSRQQDATGRSDLSRDEQILRGRTSGPERDALTDLGFAPDDPLQTHPSHPENLPSRETFEASHRAAVAGQMAKIGQDSTPKDPLDWSDRYNTQLSPQDEAKFQNWKQKYAPNDTGADYDLRGAFKAGVTPDGDRGHFPDTFKKPNHPTFSDESQYSGKDGFVGGHWGDGTYQPSATNLAFRSPAQLQQYFKQQEPDTRLMLGGNSTPMLKAGDHPGVMERIKEMFLGGPDVGTTPLGRAMGRTNFDSPTEPSRDSDALIRPTALTPENPTSVAGGVAKGAAQVAEGLTTPGNLLIMAGSGGLGVLKNISGLLPRAISAGFSADMLHSAYQQYPEVKAAIDRKDWPGAAEAITKTALTAGMGALAGLHAVRGEGAAPVTPGRAAESARAGMEALGFEPEPSPKGGLEDLGFKQDVQNPGRRVSGSSNPPLNDQGRAEMADLAQRTAGQFTKINAAPNDRAVESGTILKDANPQAQTSIDDGLKPWSMGEHEGQPIETEKAAIAKRIGETPDEAPPGRGEQSTEDGEPFNAARARTIEHAQQQIDDAQPGERVLNIASGRTLRIVDAWLKNDSPEDGAIDTDHMMREGDWHGTGDLFHVEEGGLKPVGDASQDGVYYARHGATDFNGEAEAESKGPPEETKQPATQIQSNVGQAEMDRAGPLVLGFYEKGEPGISHEVNAVNPRLVSMVHRSAEGKPDGYLNFYLDDDLQKVAPKEHGLFPGIYVDPAARRSGIASQLYDAAAAHGFDLSHVSGSETTPEGAAFLNARRARQGASSVMMGAGLPNEGLSLEGLGFEPERTSAQNFPSSVGAKQEAAEPALPSGLAGTVAQVPTDQIHADPVRFQFKQAAGGKAGVTDEFKDVRAFDPEKSGILSVWRDPADGKTYVVNGHHRLEMAQRLGAPSLTVRYLDAPDATSARTKGALINIAEGRGDALDAAKVFRDSDFDASELESRGVSLKGEKARQGLALANLDPHLFGKVVSGDIPIERASVIGEGLTSHEDQRQIVDVMQASEKNGKRLTNDQVAEMIRLAKGDTAKTSEQQESLFGTEEVSRSLIKEKADVSDYVRKRLAQKKKIFQTVGNEAAASHLGSAGNVIKAEQNAQVAETTGRVQALYDKLSTSAGLVSDELNRAAAMLASGESARDVKERAYSEIKSALVEQAKALTGAPRLPAERLEGDASRRPDQAGTGEQNLFGPSSKREVDAKRGERGSIKLGDIPGAEAASRFFDEDVAPTAKRVASDFAEAKDQIQKVVAPTLRGDAAEMMGLSLRQRMAQFARRFDQGTQRLKDARDFFNARSPQENYRFIDDIEHGRDHGDEHLNTIARTFRTMLDQRRREVQGLGEDALKQFYLNYFPHVFERPEVAAKSFADFFRNRSMEGPKSFLKRREFPTFKEALDAGQKPISDNPVDLVMLKVREMDRYLLAHNTLRDMAESGIAKRLARTEEERGQQPLLQEARERIGIPTKALVATKADLPPNFTRIADPVGGGKWYAEDGAAQVLNNFLSPGLRARSGVARILLGLNNVMNSANLGLSAFHLQAETISSIANRAGLGFIKAMQGHPLDAGWHVLSSPAAPFIDYLKGSQMLRDWYKPGSEGAPIAAITDALMKGGGRAGQPADYKNKAVEAMVKQWRRGNWIGAGLRSPFAALEVMAKPLMEHLVPRMKLGAFADIAQHEMERLGPGASVEDVQRTMARTWDHVENRLGEMTYDNLFWNRTFKDVMQLAVRSVGWNLGDLREMSSAASALKDIATGKGKQADLNGLGFVMGYAFTAATIGAMRQYLHTGQGPQELMDYFWPKREDGKRYVSAPYIKDAYQLARNLPGTLIHKTGPLVNTLAEMVTNKDYYDRPIRNLDDPLVKQLQQEAEFIGRQMLPFTLQEFAGAQTKSEQKKAAVERADDRAHPEHAAEHFLGVQPAPAALQPGYKPRPDRR